MEYRWKSRKKPVTEDGVTRGQGSEDLLSTVSLSAAFEASTMFIIHLKTNTIFENPQ